jgi:hypothetical protein
VHCQEGEDYTSELKLKINRELALDYLEVSLATAIVGSSHLVVFAGNYPLMTFSLV